MATSKEKIKKIKDIIDGYNTMPINMDIDVYLFDPVEKELGNNVDEIFQCLNKMEVEDLDYISGMFDRIYGKHMTEDVWNRLGEIEDKIKKYKAK